MPKKINWTIIRISLLAITFLGLSGVLIRVILEPKPEVRKTIDYLEFPKAIPLAGWQAVKSNSLEKSHERTNENTGESEIQKITKGHFYQYEQNTKPLKVEAWSEKYVGNISFFLLSYKQMKASSNFKVKYQDDIGYYAFFDDLDHVYLTACINPKGETTVTDDQFSKNRYANGWGIQRAFLWLIGQQDLFESRCLWTLMWLPDTTDPTQLDLSISLDEKNVKLNEVEQELEKAWLEWYQWWKANLPEY